MFLADFNQVYCENWEQKAERKDLKKQFGQRRRTHTIGAKEVVVAKEIATNKVKLSNLRRYNTKYALRHLRNQQDHTYCTLKGVAVQTHLRSYTVCTEVPKKLFPQNLFHHS